MSVLRGAGRQGLGAALNLAAYWGIGIPLAALLGLKLRLSAPGFWLALLCTSGLQSLVQALVISRCGHDRMLAAACATARAQQPE